MRMLSALEYGKSVFNFVIDDLSFALAGLFLASIVSARNSNNNITPNATIQDAYDTNIMVHKDVFLFFSDLCSKYM